VGWAKYEKGRRNQGDKRPDGKSLKGEHEALRMRVKNLKTGREAVDGGKKLWGKINCG